MLYWKGSVWLGMWEGDVGQALHVLLLGVLALQRLMLAAALAFIRRKKTFDAVSFRNATNDRHAPAP